MYGGCNWDRRQFGTIHVAMCTATATRAICVAPQSAGYLKTEQPLESFPGARVINDLILLDVGKNRNDFGDRVHEISITP